jgi:hypothetical protein
MWHVCEEAEAADVRHFDGELNGCDTMLWENKLNEYAQDLLRRFPFQRQEIEKWWNVCRIQFPIYVAFWQKHPDMLNRVPLLQERVFDVSYDLPSGRIVRLRGKWDSVDLVDGGIILQENKSKGDIDEQQIKRQLTFDLQTMLYLVALEKLKIDSETMNTDDFLPDEMLHKSIKGIRYNVVRRPLSGGKGTIVQRESTKGTKCIKCKGSGQLSGLNNLVSCPKCRGVGRIGGKPAETKEAYFERLATYIRNEPETYFMRWNVGVTPSDIQRFRKECLDPTLEQLCDWWQWIRKSPTDPFGPNNGCEDELDRSVRSNIHFRMPFGVYSPLLDGGSTDVDEVLLSGSEAGLRRVDDLFPELK